jgi:CubicO group peptidase (beta-lactamase class C family)
VRTRLAAIIVCLALTLTAAHARQVQIGLLTAAPFESYLESLRLQTGVPAISGTILQDGQVIWERGLGFQHQEARIRATPDTPYPIGDLSQTIASVLLLQCTEQRRVDVADSARRYGIGLPESTATLRHILSHTSAGTPGEAFRYDPDRYAQLSAAVEACILQPYRKTVAVNVLERLAMKDSVPGRDLATQPSSPVSSDPLFNNEVLDRYRRILERMAVPYRVDKRGKLFRTDLAPDGINAATGLVSTVRDLSRFDAALDSALLLNEETLSLAWTNVTTSDRTPLPTGLGWFVQTYRGEPVVWHFGMIANAYSSLIIKLPSRRLTLILLANSDGLSAPFQLDAGDITRSLFANLFLRLYS